VKTKEKVYFIADVGFGGYGGHTLPIVKALYGLRLLVSVGLTVWLTPYE